MTALSKIRRRVWIALMLPALLATVVVLGTPKRALSCSERERCGSEFYYYSDWSFTELVGIRQWDCDCNYSEWGTTSDYVDWLPSPCCQ